MDSQFFIPKEFEELLKEYSLSTSTDGDGNQPCSGDLRGIQTNSINYFWKGKMFY